MGVVRMLGEAFDVIFILFFCELWL